MEMVIEVLLKERKSEHISEDKGYEENLLIRENRIGKIYEDLEYKNYNRNWFNGEAKKLIGILLQHLKKTLGRNVILGG